MLEFKRLKKVEIIRNTLGTVVNCEQRGATRTFGQARRPLAHGNARCYETMKHKVFWRNGGGFWYAISDKSLITYHQANPSVKEKPRATRARK